MGDFLSEYRFRRVVPFALVVIPVPPFDIAHPLNDIHHAFRAGDRVAQLDQPVIIIVLAGIKRCFQFRSLFRSYVAFRVVIFKPMGII